MGMMRLNMGDNPRFKNEEARKLMALTLALDPTIKEELYKFLKMGAHNIRPSTMLVRRAGTELYDEVPDPCFWVARVNQYVGALLIRSRDGNWWINGC